MSAKGRDVAKVRGQGGGNGGGVEHPEKPSASSTVPAPDSHAAIVREQREFFYVGDDGHVQKITGYICEGTKGYWWCPAVGVSACEGYHLFRDRVDAYDRAHANALQALHTAQANLERIEAERWA